MELPDLKHDYYDAHIREVTLGPRRELRLAIELCSHRRLGPEEVVFIRFGGIENFSAVSEFFEDFSSSPSCLEGLHFLRYSAQYPSKPSKLRIEMQFDRIKDEICVSCRSVSVFD